MSNEAGHATARRRRGLMLVLSSPSGAGKTTLTRRLVQDDPEVQLSISWTTRPPRVGEEDGVDAGDLFPHRLEPQVGGGVHQDEVIVVLHQQGGAGPVVPWIGGCADGTVAADHGDAGGGAAAQDGDFHGGSLRKIPHSTMKRRRRQGCPLHQRSPAGMLAPF